jgi:hypothetical protein
MNQEPKEGGISRRSVLKRIGAGAAIAWTAPILTSIRTPAFAQSVVKCSQCAGDFCSGQSTCGTEPPFGCPCAQIVGQEPNCFCYHDDFCVNRTPCPGGQGDCPAGQTCVHTCCDAVIGSPVCWDPCTQPLSRRTGHRVATSGARGGKG